MKLLDKINLLRNKFSKNHSTEENDLKTDKDMESAKKRARIFDLILAIVLIGSVLITRFYDAKKDSIQLYFEQLKHPEEVRIESCLLENNMITVKAVSNGKYRNSSPQNDDTDFYLLEFEPFETGYELKRYISVLPKQKDLLYKVPVNKEDGNPRRYYGDRKYNRFGVCVWDGEKYILVSNLRYIDEGFEETDTLQMLEETEDDNTINIIMLNEYIENKPYVIKSDATIANYINYYVPDVYERVRCDMVKTMVSGIYNDVRKKYPYKNINWYLGKNVNLQTDNYYAKATLNTYVDNYYRAIQLASTTLKYAKKDFLSNEANDNIDVEKFNKATDKLCLMLNDDEKYLNIADMNYNYRDFYDYLKKIIDDMGKIKLYAHIGVDDNSEVYKFYNYIH